MITINKIQLTCKPKRVRIEQSYATFTPKKLGVGRCYEERLVQRSLIRKVEYKSTVSSSVRGALKRLYRLRSWRYLFIYLFIYLFSLFATHN